jgi:hypothetical protein
MVFAFLSTSKRNGMMTMCCLVKAVAKVKVMKDSYDTKIG